MLLSLFRSRKFWIIVLILILIVGVLFYWQKDRIRNFLRERRLAKIRAPAEDYSVVNNSDKHFVVNKKDEFKLPVPDNWKVVLGAGSAGMSSSYRSILHSKDFSYRPSEGCLIEFHITRLKQPYSKEIPGGREFYLFEDMQTVEKRIEFLKKNQNGKGRIISVDGREGIREGDSIGENIGKNITVKVPTKERVYVFRMISFSKKCNGQLKYILNSLSIGDITL